MRSYNQGTLIENQLNQTEIILKKAIEWQLIPHSQLSLRPSAESWSANECV